MNVSPVTSSSITATSLTAVTTSPAPEPPVRGSSGSDSTRLSKLGELMGKLQDLEASDPDKAKQVLSKIASDLSAKAEETGDDRMKALAGKFDEAATTGDLSRLQPRAHGGGEHHHHRPPPAGDAAGANAAVSDASKVASYASAQQDRRAEIESIISSALDGSTTATASAG
jgi:hypothetical protein